MTGADFYRWQAADRTVLLSFDVISKIGADFGRMPGDEEHGGILLGRVLNSGEVQITGFEWIASRHRRGIAYDLGARERDAFARHVQQLARRRSAAKPVGFFRSHHRPGLFLDQDDFALMSEAFSHWASVALLIRPEASGAPTAGFFYWEEGDIDRRQTQLAFPFEAPGRKVPEPAPRTEPRPRLSPTASRRRRIRIPAWQAIAAAALASVAAFGMVAAIASRNGAASPVQSPIAVTIEPASPAGNGFRPAEPASSLNPAVPAPLLASLHQPVPVDVKVSIDHKGVVRTTEVLNGSGTRLASLAADNLFYTDWKPAHAGRQAVDSELVLHYRFSPTSPERR